MHIAADTLSDPRVIDLIRTHVERARAISPPESTHAFDPAGLRAPEVSFWSAWDHDHVLGIGALLELDPDHGEVKSMHTAEDSRRRGVAAALLGHILSVARTRGYARLSLETGSMPYFAPARALYARHGFVECQPFGGYWSDPNSIFMTRDMRLP